MTTPKAHVALSRFLDLTKSAQMTVPKGQNDRTKSGGPYQKRNENAMTVPNVRGSLVDHQVRVLIREEHVARDFRGTGCPRHSGECLALAHDRAMPQPSPKARTQTAMKCMAPQNTDYSDTLVLLRPAHIRRRRGAGGTTAKLTP